MKRIILLAVGIVLVVCAGCVEVASVQKTSQHAVTVDEAQLIARWGTPTDRHVFDDRSQTLTWAYQGSYEKTALFNASGRVRWVTSSGCPTHEGDPIVWERMLTSGNRQIR